MKTKCKIDSLGRLTIPKVIRESLHLTDVILDIDEDKKELRIYNDNLKSTRECIKSRLNKKDITKSERNFLEKLLENNL